MLKCSANSVVYEVGEHVNTIFKENDIFNLLSRSYVSCIFHNHSRRGKKFNCECKLIAENTNINLHHDSGIIEWKTEDMTILQSPNGDVT